MTYVISLRKKKNRCFSKKKKKINNLRTPEEINPEGVYLWRWFEEPFNINNI